MRRNSKKPRATTRHLTGQQSLSKPGGERLSLAEGFKGSSIDPNDLMAHHHLGESPVHYTALFDEEFLRECAEIAENFDPNEP